MVLWNEYSRDIRKGIHIGKDPKCPVIIIPSDFDTNIYINKVEVHKNI
jgi:hypothetical protein